MDGRAILFGPFRLHTEQRLLLEGDSPVRLGSRAFDILAALVERAGEVVDKDQLIARAWPQTFVEDSNLKIQMSALRRALGDGQVGHRYIVTVPGRGYNFVAPVRRDETLRDASAPPAPSTTPHNLPFAVTRTIGRDDPVAALVARLSRERLVTIVGAGGIGKTTVALAVAESMMASYEHGVWLVDLARLADPRLVPSAVATVLGLEIRTTNPLHGLAAAVRDRRMLLLLDNCEHVIDAAAGLAEAILGGARGVSILATSREPLAVAGEGEYRLAPLGVPKASPRLTAAEAAPFPAVQLFVERVNAIVEDFALTDANAPAVAEICRRLDGLPLAIEFAAPRVEVLGVEGLAARLDDSLQLLGARRRTTAPRQRTMRAVIDWSYGLLSADEQAFFRALGIFQGVISVEAAAFVAMNGADPCDTIDRLADLVAKSLVVADVSGPQPRFRLLDTTRAHAIEKLGSCGERAWMARRHAAYYLNHLKHAGADAPLRSTAEWLSDYAVEIDNVRSALDWAFSPTGEGSLGVSLTAAAVPLWLRLSLLEECGSRARQALRALATLGAPDSREEMVLRTALGASLPDPPDMAAAFTRVLEIAEALEDPEYQLRALRGLYFHNVTTNQFRAALALAQRFQNLATSRANQSDLLVGERMLSAVTYILGDLVGARRHLEQLLAHYATTDLGQAAVSFDDVVRFHHDGQVETCLFLSGVLWLQGFSHQALRMAERSLAAAEAIGHVTSQCLALALGTAQLAFWTGDLSAAADYTRELADLSARNGLSHWAAYGARYRRVIALKGGNVGGFEGIAPPDAYVGNLSSCTELAEALAKAGRSAEGLAVLDDFEAQSPELGAFTSEFLRVRGELLLLQTTPADTKLSEDFFRQALNVARQHGALSLELRAAASLARLLRDQGRQGEAVAGLRPIYERFTEGFDTADLIAAKHLLDELNDARRLTRRHDLQLRSGC
ncbi:MAG TPA: winged helix-turn-helix domain-containing protein [Caulobacteraceae bacterium]|jgi:predicted ATPase/DNA-binding winged helix-turn-helix (wHTH) protein